MKLDTAYSGIITSFGVPSQEGSPETGSTRAFKGLNPLSPLPVMPAKAGIHDFLFFIADQPRPVFKPQKTPDSWWAGA